jgi:hypothetical protein
MPVSTNSELTEGLSAGFGCVVRRAREGLDRFDDVDDVCRSPDFGWLSDGC